MVLHDRNHKQGKNQQLNHEFHHACRFYAIRIMSSLSSNWAYLTLVFTVFMINALNVSGMLKYGRGSRHSAGQSIEDICRDLHCQRERYTWTSHPALEGTKCGEEMVRYKMSRILLVDKSLSF